MALRVTNAGPGRRLAVPLALALAVLAVVLVPAEPASAHQLPKFFARQNSDTLMKRICNDDPRPCRGWGVQQCARRSVHRVDCRVYHAFLENGVEKICRMWAKSTLSGNIVTTRILRATVNCRPR